jgi:AcrR family transcriptional regulator
MGRERLPPGVLSSHQRERILAAALDVFAQRGYQESTIDNIAVAAKTSVGSFYSLFEGKEDCFLAVFDRVVERAKARVAESVQTAEGWTEETILGFHELIELFVADPQAARIVLIEAPTAGDEAVERYEGLLKAASRWLHAGRAEGSGSSSLPESFALASVAGLAFFLQQRLLGPEANEVQPLLDEAAYVVLEPVVGPDRLHELRQGTNAA